MITKDIIIPSDAELTVEEVNLSSTALRTASFHLGKYCEQQNHEYMLCRDELKDPRKCINEGKCVTSCSLEFFRLLKKTCLGEFNQHASCLFRSSADYNFEKCRLTQGVYDKCVLENMNIERPAYGYYTRARVHDTTRPKPVPPPKVLYEDASDSLPEDAAKSPAKYGSRLTYFTE